MFGILLMSAPSADAQSFLKKAKEKMEKAKEQVEKVNKTVQKGSAEITGKSSISSPSSSSTASSAVDSNDENEKEAYPNLIHGKLVRDKRKSLKTTSSTKMLESTSDSYGLGDFHDGMALVTLSGKHPYFINKQGEALDLGFDLAYLEYGITDDMLPMFDNGKVLLRKGNDAVIVDKSGKITKTFTGDIVNLYGFSQGVGMIQYKKDGKYVVEWIDTNGNKIYPDLSAPSLSQQFMHKAPRSLSEGMRAYSAYDPERFTEVWGFVDNNGKWAVKPEYSVVKDFQDGLAAVLSNDQNYENRKWGFIDKTGKLVIDCKFSKEPSNFDNGYALVENRAGDTVVIDKTGSVVWTVPEGWEISTFCDGYAVLQGYEENGMGGYRSVTYGVTDGGPKKVSYQTEDKIESILVDPNSKKAYYKFGGEYGLLDIPTMTSKAEGLTRTFSDGLAAVKDGYVNEDGEYAIKITLSEF